MDNKIVYVVSDSVGKRLIWLFEQQWGNSRLLLILDVYRM